VKRWLLVELAGLRDQAAGVVSFTSARADQPLENDLRDAARTLADRQLYAKDAAPDTLEAVLVSLEGAEQLTFDIAPAAQLVTRGSL
jgi:hypothetical protein